MVMWMLLACTGMGTLETAEGPDKLRTALFFVPENTLSVTLYGARRAYVLLANSTMPCWPVDDDGDPTTPTTSTDKLNYWKAQRFTMLSREGGVTIAFTLALAPEEDWLGRYSMHADAWGGDAMAQYVQVDGRVAAGAWLEVFEAAVEGGSGLDYALDDGIEVLNEAHEIGIGAPAWVDVERKDTELAGTFDLAPAEYKGTFRAEYCGNIDLLKDLYNQLTGLGSTDEPEPDTAWEI